MRLADLIALVPLAATLLPGTPASAAIDHPTPVAGWNEFISGAAALPDQILDKLPLDMRDDPQVRQEVGRLALTAIVSEGLRALSPDGDHPLFLPSLNIVLNAGQPNADTIYRSARITPGGSYRLRGLRGTARLVKLGQTGPGPGDPTVAALPPSSRPYLDFDDLRLDKDGHYDLLISPEKPAGYKGDWWKLEPGTAMLILRTVASDWSKERDPTISIERVDARPSRPRPSTEEMEQLLRGLPAGAQFLGTLLVDYPRQLREEGYLHSFKLRGPRPGGLAGQYYYESFFDLKDDEALVLEVKVPSQCKYRSLMLINEIEQAIDWYNNHSSLNDAQDHVDKDGVLRVVVSPKDPGVPNWLDTAGHARGMIQGRWTECSDQPVPTVQKVKLAEVRKLLPGDTPHVTPQQRDAIIRQRRAAFQQRPLW